MSEATLTPPAEKKEKQQTSYTILRKQKGTVEPGSPSAAVAQPAYYEVVGMQIAAGSMSAIRAYAKENKAEGVFVAVPSRSWTEKTVAFEQTPQLKIT